MTDLDHPAGDTRLVQLKYCRSGSHLDLTQRISFLSLTGLPLLYASAYFLPPLGTTGAYLLPSHDLFMLIILPSLISVAIGGAVVYAISTAARKWCTPQMAMGGAVGLLALLTLIALKGIAEVCGYNWQDRIPRGQELLSSLRYFRIGISSAVVLAIWATRRALPTWTRLLSSVGWAFCALAVIRLLMLWNASHANFAMFGATAASAVQPVQVASITAGAAAEVADVRPRRVVWVIFDESDFNRIYTAEGADRVGLTNFARLARSSVFATNANSPGSATLYSIPALLTGVPISGDGIRIDRAASLSLAREGAKPLPFGEATSIFGTLAASGRSASVLGFFHPYCKLFRLRRCDSFAYPDIGLDAALWANVPDSISNKLRRPNYWEKITQGSLRLLPEYLALDDALTFLHLNVPHLPADYADHMLHLPPSSNPLTEYSRNLLLADQILGEIVQDLQRQVSHHELLLVVSTDHWLRNRWYRANERETAQPVPLIMWKVGEVNGHVLSQPLSTVHTAAMILDYLNGNLSTQADIAQWWVNKPVYPSFIAPET